MELHLKIIGCALIPLAIVHGIFPRYFQWKTELAGLSLINRQLMYVHTFFIALAVLLIGLLCVFCAPDLVHTPLGRAVSAGLFVFWFGRLLFQFFVYSPALWRGKRFETAVHIVFSALWVYLSAVFGIVAFG